MGADQELEKFIASNGAIMAITKLYYASYFLDLPDDSFAELHTDVSQVRATIGEQGNLRATMRLMGEQLVLPSYKEVIAEFTDIETLDERMRDKDCIVCEYEGNISGWSEASFVVVDRLENGDLHHVLFLIRTISERKQVELAKVQTLKDDLEFERLAMFSIQKVLGSSYWNVRLDDEGNILGVHCDDAFRELLGYTVTDELDAELLTRIVHADDADKVRKLFYTVITDSTMQSVFDMEFRVLVKNDGYKWVRAAGAVLKQENIQGKTFFGVLVDIDEKIHAQQSFIVEKQKREEQLSILSSIADIYLTMHYIDLIHNTAVEISSVDHITRLADTYGRADEKMRYVMQRVVDEKYKQTAHEFTNLADVAERLKDKQIISEELLGVNVGWFRASFIVVDRDKNGIPFHVLFTTMVIEEEKRREEELLRRSNTDKLTRFFNRTAYEEHMSAYAFNPPEDDFTFVSLDLNGLKEVNDTYGHAAGDELIKGAASCMQDTFGSIGTLYRIGGDEFVAMVHAPSDMLACTIDNFERAYRTWQGRYVESMSISCGWAQKSEFEGASINDLAEIADKQMYEQKAKYYKEKGVDRRGQLDAFNAICNSYTRIAKVNLTKDNYQNIRVSDEDKQVTSLFSESIQNFVRDGYVAEEDVEFFLKCTKLKGLQQYFKRGNKTFSMRYRRKIGDEYRLVMMEIIRTPDYTDDNQHVFVYIKDIDFM